jgi:glycosyltransferase involved in cell wall biosynthesis
MEIVYDALAPEHFRPTRSRDEVRRELGLPPDAIAAGIVGGVQEWKGQAVFLEAFARARANRPDLRGLIVGGVHRAGREYAAQLHERARALALGDALTFTGFRADAPDVISALDVVVHASVRPEPFGRVILEAMLLGKPVIAADAGGVPELIDDGRTGFLVPAGDVPALASRLEQLSADASRRREIGSAARDWAIERFALGRHVEAMSAIYDSISERKKNP